MLREAGAWAERSCLPRSLSRSHRAGAGDGKPKREKTDEAPSPGRRDRRDLSLVSDASSGAALSTLTDGVFRPAGTQWQNGTVWRGNVTSNFQIDFAETSEVMGAVVQGDNNDTYRMWCRDIVTGNYVDLWTIDPVGGAGMRTRPNQADNGQIFSFDTSVLTDSIRIGAIDGDNAYSPSEVQACGVVPAPGAVALLGSRWAGRVALGWSGRAGLVGSRRRR
jgi:hypothetical protein